MPTRNWQGLTESAQKPNLLAGSFSFLAPFDFYCLPFHEIDRLQLEFSDFFTD
jgi:hypothetical protein